LTFSIWTYHQVNQARNQLFEAFLWHTMVPPAGTIDGVTKVFAMLKYLPAALWVLLAVVWVVSGIYSTAAIYSWPGINGGADTLN